jgi:hypothetical protein
MHFHPLLQDAKGRVFLIHCNAESNSLTASLLVVDGFVDDEWLQINETQNPHLPCQGVSYLVQLPTEVVGQPERYKGYDVVLPLKRLG